MNIWLPIELWAGVQQALPAIDFQGRRTAETKVGRAEPHFEAALREAGFAIADEADPVRGVIVPQYRVPGIASKYGNDYTPDFAYLNPTCNLRIDIEIDEEHHLTSGEALFGDQARNRTYVGRGWGVVRFPVFLTIGTRPLADELREKATALRRLIDTLERGTPGEKDARYLFIPIQPSQDYGFVFRRGEVPAEALKQGAQVT
jgi:hypothetical protein